MNNQQIASLFKEIAAVYTLQGDNRFRISAYQEAANSIEQLNTEVKDLWQKNKLRQIPGIGPNMAGYLEELFQTGKVKHFEDLKKGYPQAMFVFLKLPGFGPKKAYRLAKELKIKDSANPLKELEKAVKTHRIAQIKGFGSISEQAISSSIDQFKKREGKQKRLLLSQADVIATNLINYLKESKEVIKALPLGSLRRMKETVGDIDIAVCSTKAQEVIDYFVKYEKTKKIMEKGEITASIILEQGIQIDLMVHPPESFGSLLQHFTGSKEHNIKLREYALKRGYSLSEYGIKKGKRQYKFKTEEDLYRFLGLISIPPELREDQGEIELAKTKRLPKLVETTEIKGDLHLHSNFPLDSSHDEGADSIETILQKAKELNYQYIGLSDHNPSISRHTDSQIISLLKRRKEYIDKINSSTKSTRVHIFNMLEVDIRPDGKLALPNKAFDFLDAIIIGIHSVHNQEKEKMSKRILKALSFPKVKILAHPTGRLLNEREPIKADWEEIFNFCQKKNIALEINSHPPRLDLPDSLIHQALILGNKFTINTDAHQVQALNLIKYGVAIARRGWCTKSDILNSKTLDQFKNWLLK